MSQNGIYGLVLRCQNFCNSFAFFCACKLLYFSDRKLRREENLCLFCICSALGPLGVSTLYLCSTCSLYIDLFVALQSAIDLIHLAQDYRSPIPAYAAIEKVCSCRSHTVDLRGLTWRIRSGPVKLLPLLGELTPHPPRGFNSPWDASGTPLGHLLCHPLGLTPPGYGATDSTSSQVHDIDIDRRNQANHASSFVLPLGHLLGTSYGIHFGSTPPWRSWDTVQQIQQAHRFVNTSDASNNVAKSSHASLIIGDFNSKVGCVIAVCVSYIFTTFYLMSVCLNPLDVPPVRMHPC